MTAAILAAVAALTALIDPSATEEIVGWATEGIAFLRAQWQAKGLPPDEFDAAVALARQARESAAKAQHDAEAAVLNGR